jgi:inhibitor of KinA sporulation pathway (predicted exonuclease)
MLLRPGLGIVNVVDVEATCWEGEPPAGETSEIIEIGVCALDAQSGRIVAAESILVRPERSLVSPYCTRLTTLTQEEVDRGIPFAEACARLRTEFAARDRVWASYGDYDRRKFETQGHDFGIPYPFGRRHVNVKTWAALVLGLPREVGMAEALRHLCLPLEGTHHRGGDDARNIARMLAALLAATRKGLDVCDDPLPGGR